MGYAVARLQRSSALVRLERLTVARRTRLTRPYPVNPLEEALPIAETIQGVNGGHPVPTELLADTLGTTLKSSAFVQKLGSSARYGLTVGSHTSEQIELTALGELLTAPRDSREELRALREAALEPGVFRRFYDIYSGKPFPEIPYASNTLVRELDVRQELTEECLRIIRLNGILAGIVTDRSGTLIVDDLMAAEGDVQPVDVLPNPALETPIDEGREAAEAPFVMVLSPEGNPIAREVANLIETLSIPAKAVEIDTQMSECVSPATSAALRSARGCIVVWPKVSQVSDSRKLRTRMWMTIGAASFQLGDRVVVLADIEDDPELSEVSGASNLVVIDPRTDGGIFPPLISALVSRSIVQVSFG